MPKACLRHDARGIRSSKLRGPRSTGYQCPVSQISLNNPCGRIAGRMRDMARPIKVLWASEDVRAELRRRANGRSTEHRDRFRAKIILLRLDGMKIKDVAARMSTSMRTVSIWSSRFEKAGLEGLADKGGRGRKPSLPAAKIARVITEATRPPKSRSRWSVRSMGRHVGISHSTVQRIW